MNIISQNNTKDQAQRILAKYNFLDQKRKKFEKLWQECFQFAMPLRSASLSEDTLNNDNNLFDSTALDATEQLAASLISELAPSWQKWFSLVYDNKSVSNKNENTIALSNASSNKITGIENQDNQMSAIGLSQNNLSQVKLDEITKIILNSLETSNFYVELHQAFLDMVTIGTSCLLIEETNLDDNSNIRFQAIPIGNLQIEEGSNGRISNFYRKLKVTKNQLIQKFPHLKDKLEKVSTKNDDIEQDLYTLIEAVEPCSQDLFIKSYKHKIVCVSGKGLDDMQEIYNKEIRSPCFVAFRWLKVPGETYGRSPVMKALPDIKTINKVIEMILQNASFAINGLWQIEDDGIINPYNIELKPGTIIPKAQGSSGLTPISSSGNFNLAQLVLTNLQTNIKRALYVDKFGPPTNQTLTATEILARSQEMNRLLGAIYGRLKQELIYPLLQKVIEILAKRGVIPYINLNSEDIRLVFNSPLANYAKEESLSNLVTFLSSLNLLTANPQINPEKLSQYLAKQLDIPLELVQTNNNLEIEV